MEAIEDGGRSRGRRSRGRRSVERRRGRGIERKVDVEKGGWRGKEIKRKGDE